MTVKDMKRTDWTRITKRKYISRECTIDGKPARESLIEIHDITAPLVATSAGVPIKIVEKGYSWVQIAVKDARWWLTSMFDEKGTLLQMYFDITDGNRFDDSENPTFRDMYLDIVLRTDKKAVLLDQDELDEALEKGAVTPDEYERTQAACAELYDYLTNHPDEVMERCKEAYHTLKAMLRNKQ